MDVNLFSAIALTKSVLPHMIERGSGHIVGVSSLAGKVGVPLRTAYCPAKHAVLGFFDSLRAEVAYHGIKVSTIVPGVVRTNTVANALRGNGEPIGASEGVMEGGLSVTEAVSVMVEQLASGKDEIEVMTDTESQMLTAKKMTPLRCSECLRTWRRKNFSQTNSVWLSIFWLRVAYRPLIMLTGSLVGFLH